MIKKTYIKKEKIDIFIEGNIIKGDNMKKNGFTLTELIAVIALLGLIIGICVPSIMVANKNIKKKTLATKVNNIESAAILYGQDHRENFKTTCSSSDQACYGISDCMCYNGTITVKTLTDPNGDGSTTDSYIELDEGKNDILNSVDESKSLMNCKIQIYQKYGKIYAIYLAKDTTDTTCWYN